MYEVQDYYQTARDNEEVFRNILRDLKDHRTERPMGDYIPKDLETELQLDEIFQKYSEGVRSGIFTIIQFTRNKETTRIIFGDVAFMSGGGAELEYLVKKDDSVEYQKPICTMKSLMGGK